MYDIIQQTYDSRSSPGNYFTDICSGALYQHYISPGFLANKRNISLIFNTNGLPVFKSSNFQFWPSFLLTNELPYQLRCIYTH